MKGNRLKKIHKAVLCWYTRHGRDLPWRKTRKPYRILLSEVMLQQTQVSRVLAKYPLFLKRFPNFKSLSATRTDTVIRAWRGMGYNNRSVRLQILAKQVTKECAGKLPQSLPELERLPGIGPYTAHALACFAFGQNVPVVDTNIRRVLQRLFPSKSDEWKTAQRVLPKRNAYDWNQALMDLGATVCLPRNPRCNICPVVTDCPSSFRQFKRTFTPKREPSRNGIPNRIYRGRIVELLRMSRRPLRATHVGEQIMSRFARKDIRWLKDILNGLERDGLLRLKNGKSELRVSLPR